MLKTKLLEKIFLKDHTKVGEEHQAALGLLHEMYHEAYRDIESQSTPTGKFAKSIDKIVADILEMVVPVEDSVARCASMGITRESIVPAKREKKMRFMEWNPFLKEFYDHLLNRLEKRFQEG